MFYAHTAAIRAKSGFFDALLSKGWKETVEKVVDLPEDHADAFDLWIHAVYHTGFLTSQPTNVDCNDPKGLTSIHNTHCLYIRAYILGDKLQDYDFMDLTMDVLIRFSDGVNYYPVKYAQLAFDHSPESSPLRQYMIDTLCFTGHQGWLENTIPAEMWAGVGKKFFELKQLRKVPAHTDGNYSGHACKYHCHPSKGTACYLTKDDHLYPC